jgi:hypothetical protein
MFVEDPSIFDVEWVILVVPYSATKRKIELTLHSANSMAVLTLRDITQYYATGYNTPKIKI